MGTNLCDCMGPRAQEDLCSLKCSVVMVLKFFIFLNKGPHVFISWTVADTMEKSKMRGETGRFVVGGKKNSHEGLDTTLCI